MFNRLRQNQRGLTLVEVLSSIILITIISIIATNLIIQSINHYKAISVENQLRDEADLIMTKFFREIYTTMSDEIVVTTLASPPYNTSFLKYKKKDSTTGKYVLDSTGAETGFFITSTKNGFQTTVKFKNEYYPIQNSRVTIHESSLITQENDGRIKVELTLQIKDKSNKTMTFINYIQPITN